MNQTQKQNDSPTHKLLFYFTNNLLHISRNNQNTQKMNEKICIYNWNKTAK